MSYHPFSPPIQYSQRKHAQRNIYVEKFSLKLLSGYDSDIDGQLVRFKSLPIWWKVETCKYERFFNVQCKLFRNVTSKCPQSKFLSTYTFFETNWRQSHNTLKNFPNNEGSSILYSFLVQSALLGWLGG